jgi:hypothetical protein
VGVIFTLFQKWGYDTYYFFKHFLHLLIKIYLFSHFGVRLWGAIKEAFIVDAIQLALKHHQLFTLHHAIKAIVVVANYHTTMGIASSSSSSDD